MQMRPQYLLLPANRAFITFTIVAAFVLNVLPWGHAPGIPDLLALVLVFWNVHQPRMVGIGIAALFGEHALTYTLLSYGAIAMHRRVPWFHMTGQMLHVLPLFLLTQCIVLLVRLAIGGAFPGWQWFLQSASCTLLWPLADWLLLAPQRQAVDRDENRPI